MKQVVLALAMLAVGAVAVGADDDEAKKDLKALQGTWEYGKYVSNGKEVEKEKLEGMTLTIKDDKWEVKKDDTVFLSGTVKLDASKKVKTADWVVTSDGDLKDRRLLSVYTLRKEALEARANSEESPAKCESTEGSKSADTTCKRVKKKD